MQTLVTPTAGRDHRVDFFRGIALAMIFVNHIPGNLWENYTTRNFGFSDSAELFVFLAGFASAFAYAKPFLGGHRFLAALKAWRRAGILYLVHATLTLFTVALFAWGALAFGDGGLMQMNDLGALAAHPLDALVGLASMGHQLRYVNILPMYVALLLMLPALLALAAFFGRNGMMLGSLALWAFAAAFWLNVPNHPYDGGWFFNPFSWQLIFCAGLYCGLARMEGREAVPYSPTLYTLALAFLAYAFLFVEFGLWGFERSFGLPVMLSGFDKTYVSLPRLLHLLALVYVFAHAPGTSVFSRVSGDNLFTRMGRHSLPVFAIGTALALVAQMLKFNQEPEILSDTALIAGGLAIQFALAAFLDWWRQAERQLKSGAAKLPAASRPLPARPAENPARGSSGLRAKEGAGIVAGSLKR